MSDALLIAAHGSRDPAGIDEFRAFADSWRALRPDRLQAEGFLEFARPTIAEAIDELVVQGAHRIVIVPAMLMAAGHVKNDVPSELHEAQERHPSVEFVMARPLDLHPALLELCATRYRESLTGRAQIASSQTLLLIVGRGTSDPDANANIARVARFLWEGYGVGWAGVAYAGLTAPSVDEALGLCRRMRFTRIVVQPYFLFNGLLLKRIVETTARHAREDTSTEIFTTGHFRNHPLLVQAFEARYHEAIHGAPDMNCALCKYRVRLIGAEADLGQPQFGHHHDSRAAADDMHRHEHQLRRRRSSRIPPLVNDTGSDHAWDEALLRRLHFVN